MFYNPEKLSFIEKIVRKVKRKTAKKKKPHKDPSWSNEVEEMYFDNILIATRRGRQGEYYLELLEGVHDHFVPFTLFKAGAKTVPFSALYDWLEDRVFPEDRLDKDNLLTELGLTEYNPLEIAKETRGCQMNDGWWLKMKPEDTFRNCTLRGQMGFSEWWVNGDKIGLVEPPAESELEKFDKLPKMTELPEEWKHLVPWYDEKR